MDIKIRFTKKAALFLLAVLLCGWLGWGCWLHSNFKARQDMKATCKANCECFANVVDYRLTNEQVRLFTRFMKESQKRRNANVLEFMNPADAVAIQQAFAACQQPRTVGVVPAKTGQPQKKVGENKTRKEKK